MRLAHAAELLPCHDLGGGDWVDVARLEARAERRVDGQARVGRDGDAERDDAEVGVGRDERGRVLAVLDHLVVPGRRDEVRAVLEVLREGTRVSACPSERASETEEENERDGGGERATHHLAVLEQVVEQGEDASLDALDAVEDEDLALLGRPHRARVGPLELAARADLAALLELRLADVAVEGDDLVRRVEERKEGLGEAASVGPGRGEEEDVLACEEEEEQEVERGARACQQPLSLAGRSERE